MISNNAIKVLERRYLTKNENGELTETVDGLFKRVAKAIASADATFDSNADVNSLENEFYDAMVGLRFMPNSPTLMNAGRPLGQLSACFVLPVPDSMEGIFDAVKNAALIHKSGGGTGFSFSRLRSAGSAVSSTGGVASGPISFLKVFNAATEAVKQGGTRRGANMGILRVDHPDIMDFIVCKKVDGEISNFNLSIGITESFMQAVMSESDYELINPKDGNVVGKLNAKDVFDLIIEMAWLNGEPGIVFLDRMNASNPTPALGEIESTNPCGEQPLLPFESCNLGSINLAKMLKRVDGKWSVDFDLLANTTALAVHFLDNVIEVNRYPLPEIDAMTRKTRKIGLGIMGWADMLFKLGLTYGSDESIALADRVMGFIHDKGWAVSRELAKVRGAFPVADESIYAQDELKPRNATITTIAPTGTISIICSASSGIEPLFALAFMRNVMDNDQLPEVDPTFEQVAKDRGFYSPEVMRELAKKGTLHDIEGIPEDVRKVFVTAHDISPEAHIKMQAAFQRHTDNAVSKTVNFANDATKEDVRKVYELAWKLGCKGVTSYRDGSRNQVLFVGTEGKSEGKSEGKTDEKKLQSSAQQSESKVLIVPRTRPELTMGVTEKVKIGCGNLYITVNYDEQGICEVFTNLGRAGGCPSQSEATSRLISTALRSGMSPNTLIEQLRGIRCLSTIRQKGLKVLSCPDAIGQVLEKVQRMREAGGTLGSFPTSANPMKKVCLDNCSMCASNATCDMSKTNKVNCPECGNSIEHEGGCVICRSCGYSKCN